MSTDVSVLDGPEHTCFGTPDFDNEADPDCAGCRFAAEYPCRWCAFGHTLATHDPALHADHWDPRLPEHPSDAWINRPHSDFEVGLRDLADGEILNPRGKDQWQSRVAQHNTPIMPTPAIPRARQAHVGDGQWLSRCRACDAFVISYGPVMFLRELSDHEYTAHGIVQEALLP